MRLRLIAIVISILLSVLISGCTGARETEEMIYIIALGIDKGEEEGTFNLTYQIALPRTGEVKQSNELTTVITVTATSLPEGFSLLKSFTIGYPTFLQTKAIIISEDLAREGISKLISPFQRFREYRGSIFFLIAEGTAENFIRSNIPTIVVTPAKYYDDILSSSKDTGYYLRTVLHQVYTRLRSKSADPYATIVAVNPAKGLNKVSSPSANTNLNDRRYFAGELPRENGNNVEFAGTALFSDDKLVGKLNNIETRMLAMLLGKFPKGYISMKDPQFGKETVNVLLRLASNPDINVSFVDGHPVINVKIALDGEFTNITSGFNYEQAENIKQIESQINEIYEQQMLSMITHTQELNADAAGFGYYAHHAFKTQQEFEDYQWRDKYREAEVHVKFRTTIRRTGLVIRTISD